MKFLKKNVKLIIGVVVGIILVSGISVYATTTYLASNVTYTNNKSVEDALDELYSMKDNKYTEQEYQDYGDERYLAGANSNGGIKIEHFVVKSGYNHYDIGFNPSFVFYTNADGQCWSFAGDSKLYIHTSSGNSSIDNFFSTGNNGFYYNYSSNTDSKEVTLYAVK